MAVASVGNVFCANLFSIRLDPLWYRIRPRRHELSVLWIRDVEW